MSCLKFENLQVVMEDKDCRIVDAPFSKQHLYQLEMKWLLA
jgi:hypothetical protein